SLRRIAHFDYWSEKVRRSVLLDAKADLLVYGNAERQIVEVAHRLAKGERIDEITDLRGTAFVRHATPPGWTEIDSTSIDEPGRLNPPIDPYAMEGAKPAAAAPCSTPDPQGARVVKFYRHVPTSPRDPSVIRLPTSDAVRAAPVLS